MRELFRTTQLGEIALMQSVFAAADIKLFLFDEHMNSLGGIFTGFAPCRFMVLDDEYAEAREILKDYGLKTEASNTFFPDFSTIVFSNILVIFTMIMDLNIAIVLSNYILRRNYISRMERSR